MDRIVFIVMPALALLSGAALFLAAGWLSDICVQVTAKRKSNVH